MSLIPGLALIFFCILLVFPGQFMGQTTAADTPLLLPTAVAFDPSGALFVAETNRHVIDRIDSSGVFTVYAGHGTQGFSGDTGAATSAQLDSPQGLAFDASGNLYIADTHNHRIRKVTATGIITTIAGTGVAGFSGDQSQGVAAQFNLPSALAIDPFGNLDIADSNNHRIRQLNLSTGVVSTVAGNGIQTDSGDGGPAVSASIDTPTGLAVDASGNLYLADTHNHRVRCVTAATGIITTVAGGGTSLLATSATATRLLLPRGLSFDSTGSLYLADTQAHRVLRVASDGTVAQIAGEGTQGFAGDHGPAAAALLDSPRSATISSAGLLTLADTGNQRVRQLDPSAVITTLSGNGTATQAALTLTSPTIAQYGTGTLHATLSSATPLTGTITLLDTANNLLTTLGTASVTANSATFSTSQLSVGTHQILATYSGDSNHAAQQSPIALLSITPAPVSASPTATTVVYGQPIPVLTGSITGILPQDASLVSATFSTSAQTLSPAATYPIATSLTGSSAGNYQITSLTPASLTIAQAATATALTASDSSPITFSARTLSTSQGTPTGHITFFDDGSSLGSSLLSSSGAATLTATLASGMHSVTAVYSGDSNFLSSTSDAVTPVFSTTSSVAQDFTLSVSGTTAQTAAAGASVAYSLAVSVLSGPLGSPIVLTATGMPTGATASFSPGNIPAGEASAVVTLTIQTAKATAQQARPIRPLSAILLWGLLGSLPLSLRRRRFARCLCAVTAVSLLGGLAGCGNAVSSNPKASFTTAVYPVTITATSTSSTGAILQHSLMVTLTLQ